ncbi:response regulator [Pseudoroseomonas cervicalis]|uniref:response regulator n=1 Tax=Teichococcus cervicalis TaxID=204525 RepID=UPI0027D83906|nr:response regulator transcription factor [Pseudoroseomonas cervicalis]
MPPQTRILVVDDDPDITALLEAYLTAEGFEVAIAAAGAEALARMREAPAALVLLDLMLPGEDGFAVLRALRGFSGVGLIMITARRSEVDRVVGLELGADDYVLKPFDPRELLARIRSVLRRCAAQAAPAGAPPPAAPAAAWPRLDRARRQLQPPHGGAGIGLTQAECSLLEQLLAHPGEVLDRDRLMRAVTGRGWEYFDRSIDILVVRLRRKLAQLPGQPVRIRTIRGSGYLLCGETGRAAPKPQH